LTALRFGQAHSARSASGERQIWAGVRCHAVRVVGPTVTFGDRVRIVSAPVTEATRHAGRVGLVCGWTTPSVTGVEVIGGSDDDFAYNVGFDEPGTDVWFAPHLVELVDHSPGLEVTIGDKRLVRGDDGAWHRPRKWPFKRMTK
jgi:hypothetical protein